MTAKIKAVLIAIGSGGGMAAWDAFQSGELNLKRLAIIAVVGAAASAKLYLTDPHKPPKGGIRRASTLDDPPPPVDPGGQ